MPRNNKKQTKKPTTTFVSSSDRVFTLPKVEIQKPDATTQVTLPSTEALLNPFQRLFTHDTVADFFKLDDPNNQIAKNQHPEFLALINHPCRGCPHLHLAYVPEQYAFEQNTEGIRNPDDDKRFSGSKMYITPPDAYKVSPAKKYGLSMPKPLCLVMPECSSDALTGQRQVLYRETWQRCPLYGIVSIHDLLRGIMDDMNKLKIDVNELKLQ